MPIQYIHGDLLSSSASVLTIPVNCRGVAGKGLALQCKQKYPEWFVAYRLACLTGRLSPGCPIFHYFPGLSNYPVFLNFPTKGDWRLPSRLEDIEKGLYDLVTAPVLPLSSADVIAFPQLGCGAGGLSWSRVQPVMEHFLSHLSCAVLIYVPDSVNLSV